MEQSSRTLRVFTRRMTRHITLPASLSVFLRATFPGWENAFNVIRRLVGNDWVKTILETGVEYPRPL